MRRIATLTGTMRYEVVCAEHNPEHPHFVCRTCGDMECLEDFDLSAVRKGIQKKRKLITEDIDLKLEGLCFKCSPERKGARSR